MSSVELIDQTWKLFEEVRASTDESQTRWDCDFLALAEWYGKRKSKDPSTKVGAVITRGREIVSLGYNGLPKRVLDLPERYSDRELKLKMIVHAERNAIIFARQNLTGCTLYTHPFLPCSVCAGMVIQADIVRVVAPQATPEQYQRWKSEFDLTQLMFQEAGVELVLLEACHNKD